MDSIADILPQVHPKNSAPGAVDHDGSPAQDAHAPDGGHDPRLSPTPADRLAMLRAHLDALWPPAWRDATLLRRDQPFLVRSYPDPAQPRPNGDPTWRSSWHRMPSDLTTLTQRALAGSETYNEYYGVNLGQADCKPSTHRRLKKTE